MDGWQDRQNTRLRGYDYNTPGAYFLTLCVEDRKCLLSRIVQTGPIHGPVIELLPCGNVAARTINQLNDFYDDLSVDSYVIMPNHIHILLRVLQTPSQPASTKQNSVVSRFISTFKRFCNKEYGKNIWQARSYDHIIRGQADYDMHLQYIYGNPFDWQKDAFYSESPLE